jgi:F0F1-type ATP synthase assembly protein I
MGCAIAATIVLAVVGGVAVDQLLDTPPIFTLIGVALGLVAAGYQLWELAQLSSKNARVGPVARQVMNVQRRRKRSGRG